MRCFPVYVKFNPHCFPVSRLSTVDRKLPKPFRIRTCKKGGRGKLLTRNRYPQGAIQSAPCAGASEGTAPVSSPRSERLPKSYGSQVTSGVAWKFSSGGGEVVCHSSPVAGHGLGPAIAP